MDGSLSRDLAGEETGVPEQEVASREEEAALLGDQVVGGSGRGWESRVQTEGDEKDRGMQQA